MRLLIQTGAHFSAVAKPCPSCSARLVLTLLAGLLQELGGHDMTDTWWLRLLAGRSTSTTPECRDAATTFHLTTWEPHLAAGRCGGWAAHRTAVVSQRFLALPTTTHWLRAGWSWLWRARGVTEQPPEATGAACVLTNKQQIKNSSEFLMRGTSACERVFPRASWDLFTHCALL